jgi:hypothetical protein
MAGYPLPIKKICPEKRCLSFQAINASFVKTELFFYPCLSLSSPPPSHISTRGFSPPHKCAFSLFNREKGERGENGGGGKETRMGQKINNRFKFKNDYIKYDVNNLRIKNVVKLVIFFISEFSRFFSSTRSVVIPP